MLTTCPIIQDGGRGIEENYGRNMSSTGKMKRIYTPPPTPPGPPPPTPPRIPPRTPTLNPPSPPSTGLEGLPDLPPSRPYHCKFCLEDVHLAAEVVW